VGLRTDADGRVLRTTCDPIAGLFACGSDAASIMRGHYPGPGINLGPALVFAYRAAMAIRDAEQPLPASWSYVPLQAFQSRQAILSISVRVIDR
jgi:FAD binding domain-containing protein